MVDFNELSEKSKRAYKINKFLLYLYYALALILFFQLGRSLIAFHYNLLNIQHLIRVNIYLVGVCIMYPTISKEINYKINRARNNDM